MIFSAKRAANIKGPAIPDRTETPFLFKKGQSSASQHQLRHQLLGMSMGFLSLLREASTQSNGCRSDSRKMFLLVSRVSDSYHWQWTSGSSILWLHITSITIIKCSLPLERSCTLSPTWYLHREVVKRPTSHRQKEFMRRVNGFEAIHYTVQSVEDVIIPADSQKTPPHHPQDQCCSTRGRQCLHVIFFL